MSVITTLAESNPMRPAERPAQPAGPPIVCVIGEEGHDDFVRSAGPVKVWEAAMWGIAGGFVVDALQFAASLVRTGRFPWQPTPTDRERNVPGTEGHAADSRKVHLVAVIIRMTVSGIVTAALAHRLPDSSLALAVGITAPILVGRIVRMARVVDRPPANGVPGSMAATAADGGIPIARVPDVLTLPAPGPEAVAGTGDGL
ncbi:hypothetical protein GCM10007977_107510 [Dactylosporangium sucinum]|uniref:Uncharacterized protein n=1 Tax=Dactylosporangium sucinum TaxID=1424081 RepID=A0A917UEV4_9ACTN|nr:hypothetical protein GCM10007977_107510 [Dactylosporangium sucinum]